MNDKLDSMGKDGKNKFKVICIIIALLIVIAVVIVVVRFDGKQNKKIQYECNDGEEIIYRPLLEENISDENGLKYVNNEILVYIDTSESKKALEEYLNSINAKIVGQIPQINQYQIQLSDEMSLEKIQNIVSEMEQISWIKHVGVNYVIETVEEFYPNDKEWKKSWKEQSGGKNWGMEAIKAPEAWEYRDKMNPVNVGVFDTVFDTDHEDLKDVFVEEPLLNFSSKENKEGNQSHGTHVAGTIAADFNNEIGVCGVCPTARLYGVAFDSKYISNYTTTQLLNVGFSYLITNDCKVINASFSSLDSVYSFCASRNNEFAINTIKSVSKEVGYFLECMLSNGFKFVICNASGNLNEDNGRYKFYRKENFNDKTELSYYDDEDFKRYNEDKVDDKVKEYFDKYGELRTESGNVDAKYEVLCAIEYKDVQDIIITVGAVEPGEKDDSGNIITYREAPYSQGGEAVDVVAPGGSTSIEEDAIYSTIPNGYGYSQGTSMATPHVSGVAAMIFALDPDIEPSKVKEIIVETALDQYGSGEHKYGLVDANAAVQSVLERKEPEDKSNNSWIEAYISYLENLSEDIKDNKKFGLFFVDDNDIPELYYNRGFGYPGGDCLIYCTRNQATEKEFLSEGYNLSYIERKGKIRDFPAEMGVASDIIYTLENGKLTEINHGRSCGDEGPKYDQNNNLIFDYHWDGQRVDEAEYIRLLTEVYDRDAAKIFYDEDNLYSFSEIIEIIRNYSNEGMPSVDIDNLSNICNLVEEHYNTVLNTDVFKVYKSESTKTSTGYEIVLRTTGKSEANVFADIVKIDTSTGKVTTVNKWVDADEWYYK